MFSNTFKNVSFIVLMIVVPGSILGYIGYKIYKRVK